MRGRFCVLITLLLLCTASNVSFAGQRGDTEQTSLTTGLPSSEPYRPVLVQIDNSVDARPLHGISKADIVYEAVYWGPRHTRYLALFNDEHPEVVGSIRSSRVYWNEFRQMWDCPFVYWGGQGRIENRKDTTSFFLEHGVPDGMLFDGTRNRWNGVLFRSESIPSPYNAMANIARLVDEYWHEENGAPYAPQQPPWQFSVTPSLGDDDAYIIEVVYESKHYAAKYVYDAGTKQFCRWYDHEEQRESDGSNILVSNVVIQYMPLKFYDDDPSLPIIETTGGGPVDIFIQGMHIRGTWICDAVGSWTRFLDSEGNDIIFFPGKTYVQMVPLDMAISYIDNEGIVHSLSAKGN